MESISLEQREVLCDTLTQIKEGILNLKNWNEGIEDMNTLLMSPNGMQAIAGNCMLIMTIAEKQDIVKYNFSCFSFVP